jgi:hypothetical protein
MRNFVYSSLWDFKNSFKCRKILRHGTFPLYFPSEEGVLRIFITLKNPSPWPGYEPATFGSSGQHTNHCTTKETWSTHLFKYTEFKNLSYLARDFLSEVICGPHAENFRRPLA